MISTNESTVVSDQSDLHLPRILCLHGGGVNARIFKLQCRALITHLKGKFRLCFAEGPYESEAGPGILPVFAEHGPYKRWLRFKPEHPQLDSQTVIKDIDASIFNAMANDNLLGATGKWVGILGFSQGAKIAGSLLLRQQIRMQKGFNKGNTSFRFAILMNGQGPLVSLDTDLVKFSTLTRANEISTDDFSSRIKAAEQKKDHRLILPTLHVHGLSDPGLHRHRQLLEHYCRKETRKLFEWDGAHRIPIKRTDVLPMVNKILEIATVTKAL